jgi:hypothetical protein
MASAKSNGIPCTPEIRIIVAIARQIILHTHPSPHIGDCRSFILGYCPV